MEKRGSIDLFTPLCLLPFYVLNGIQDIIMELTMMTQELQETCTLLDQQMDINGVSYIVENGTRCVYFSSYFLSVVVKLSGV